MKDSDLDPAEEREALRLLHKLFGHDTRLILVLAALTGKHYTVVYGEWRKQGERLENALRGV